MKPKHHFQVAPEVLACLEAEIEHLYGRTRHVWEEIRNLAASIHFLSLAQVSAAGTVEESLPPRMSDGKRLDILRVADALKVERDRIQNNQGPGPDCGWLVEVLTHMLTTAVKKRKRS